jgi:hypothetical protein
MANNYRSTWKKVSEQPLVSIDKLCAKTSRATKLEFKSNESTLTISFIYLHAANQMCGFQLNAANYLLSAEYNEDSQVHGKSVAGSSKKRYD